MIRWTGAGAVAEPDTLQIRASADLDGRIDAGAPAPSRTMTPPEILANLEHFTVGRRGPRTSPCTRLVLAGIGGGEPLRDVVRRALEVGVQRVVVHLGRPWEAGSGGVAVPAGVDAVVVRVTTALDAERAGLAGGYGAPVDAVVVLERSVLGELDAVVGALIRARPSRVVFTWPFSGADVPQATEAAGAVRPWLQRLEAVGIACGVKGIPLCTLAPGPASDRWEASVWRTANRFYVDADHQLDAALMFFPDVVRFAKADSCRFCAAVLRCDGVVETWLRRGLAGTLVPLG